MKEALLEDQWDVVTLQQASHDSGIEGTYEPYLKALSAYVKQFAPSAEQMMHQTWAYETDSNHGEFYRYGKNQKRMYNALKKAYRNAAGDIGAKLIPCGDAVQYIRGLREFDYANGGQSLCRDGFHLHLIYGRYLAAAVWYETVLHGNILENAYVPPACEASCGPLLQIIRSAVHGVCSGAATL